MKIPEQILYLNKNMRALPPTDISAEAASWPAGFQFLVTSFFALSRFFSLIFQSRIEIHQHDCLLNIAHRCRVGGRQFKAVSHDPPVTWVKVIRACLNGVLYRREELLARLHIFVGFFLLVKEFIHQNIHFFSPEVLVFRQSTLCCK